MSKHWEKSQKLFIISTWTKFIILLMLIPCKAMQIAASNWMKQLWRAERMEENWNVVHASVFLYA